MFWNGSKWVPLPPKIKAKNEQPLPKLGIAYVLNYLCPGTGFLYLEKLFVGLFVSIVFSGFVTAGLFSSDPDAVVYLIVAFFIQLLAVITTKYEYQKLVSERG
jgi:hypothetical protein